MPESNQGESSPMRALDALSISKAITLRTVTMRTVDEKAQQSLNHPPQPAAWSRRLIWATDLKTLTPHLKDKQAPEFLCLGIPTATLSVRM